MPEFFKLVEQALLQPQPKQKCRQVSDLRDIWKGGKVEIDAATEILPIADPGRPLKPELVDPRDLGKRSFASEQGRNCLLHAIAHIEFNAINIALDAVYRFRELPSQFVDDWLLVAAEEAKHFTLLTAELERRGSCYGAFQAHRGLWDMVCKTAHDPLHRMALVPRVMEARGLDVTPAMMKKFGQFQDPSAVEILQVIYEDEIGHVRIGNFWFRFLCEKSELDPEETFRQLIDSYMGGQLRGPFNRDARLQAGFAVTELDRLEAGAG